MTRPAQISIRQIALTFVAGLLILIGLIGGIAAYQTRSVTNSLEQHSQQAASAELRAVVERLLGRTASQADTLAAWDETRQQLVTPEYYAYWRDQRAYEGGILVNRLARTALYRDSGQILAAGGSMPAQLPAARLLPERSSWFSQESGITMLNVVFPVYRESGGQALLGYGLLRFDFMNELVQHNQFHFVDPASISLTLQAGEALNVSQLYSRMQFSARTDPDQLKFQAIFSRTLLALLALLILAALAGFVIYNHLLVRPLGQLSREINAMQQGQFNLAVDHSAPMQLGELERIRRSLHDYQLQLRELHGSLEDQNREFHSQARQDALTGCHNRRAYEEDWEHFRANLHLHPQGVAFLLFDCDRFKTINDTYGHAKGDRVLTLIADALVMALRANDRLYRLGGDEFATFLSRTTPAQAKQIAQRCHSLIDAASFKELGINEPVGISIGIAFCEASQLEHIDELPKQADVAMYTAKQPGRTRIALYGDDAERASQTLVASLETSALFQALATPGMIEMHYQPIHALPGRKLAYYEALARIRYNGQLIMPGAFLPVVSSRRLETEFDTAVLQQIEMDIASDQLPPGSGLSINLSAQSISNAEIVSQLLELSRHNARYPMVLEITETSLITQMTEVRTYLDLLRSLNYRIAMDDFGTGYSPLRYLVDLPVDVVKFDISLVNKLAQNDRAGQVVADFARMMRDAGYALVAEGIESEEVLLKVESLGFEHAQGFFLGRPVALAQISQTPSPEPWHDTDSSVFA